MLTITVASVTLTVNVLTITVAVTMLSVHILTVIVAVATVTVNVQMAMVAVAMFIVNVLTVTFEISSLITICNKCYICNAYYSRLTKNVATATLGVTAADEMCDPNAFVHHVILNKN